MNWLDTAVLAVIVLSALMAFARGFAREVLGIGAWIGAFFFAVATVALVRPQVRAWIGNLDIADPVAFAGMFLIGLVVLSIITGMVGNAVRDSMLGGIDRSLGVVFGIARGVVLVAAAYVLAGWVVSTDRWPDTVQQARALPYAFDVASWLARLAPPEYRPNVPLPPLGRQTRSADILQAAPQGRALSKP